MASGKTLTFAQAILDHITDKAPWTPPAEFWIALSSAVFTNTATGAAMQEITGNGYGRARIALADMSPADPTASTANQTRVDFPEPTSDWPLAVRSYYITDAETGGRALYGCDLSTLATVQAGAAPYFDIGDISITELITA